MSGGGRCGGFAGSWRRLGFFFLSALCLLKRGGCRAHIKGILPAKLEFQVALHLAVPSEGSVTPGDINVGVFRLVVYNAKRLPLRESRRGNAAAAPDWTVPSEWEQWRG